MKPVEELFRLLVHLLIVDGDAFLKFPSYKNILRNRQMPQHIQFLVNNHDSGVLRFSRIMKLNFLPLVSNPELFMEPQ